MFALITAVGLSQFQFADQNSPRNLFILGFAICAPLLSQLLLLKQAASSFVRLLSLLRIQHCKQTCTTAL